MGRIFSLVSDRIASSWALGLLLVAFETTALLFSSLAPFAMLCNASSVFASSWLRRPLGGAASSGSGDGVGVGSGCSFVFNSPGVRVSAPFMAHRAGVSPLHECCSCGHHGISGEGEGQYANGVGDRRQCLDIIDDVDAHPQPNRA